MSEIKKLTIGQDELDLSKYSYNTKIDNNSGNSIYKKITITTESNKASDGCLIFGRNQFYLLNLMYASGYMGALHEIGTKANDLKPNVNARYIHLKVKGTADKRETIIYAAMDAYNFISIFSAAKIIVEDSTKSEFDSATTNVTYRYIPNESEIKVKYTGTNLKPTRDTTASWRTLFGNTAGVYFTNYSESNCFTNQPNRYGFLRTIIQGNEVNQMFTTQPDGIIYSRAGNATGWNNSATDTGAFTKITPNNGTLTIQKNGTNVQTFSANQSTNVTANIEVPTKVSDIENDLNFIENDTTQVCGEGSDIELEGTTKAPLEIKKLGGKTEQATYDGKNLFAYIGNVKSSQSGVTGTLSADGTITYSGILSADNQHLTNDINITDILEDGQVYTVSQTESFGDACSLEIRGRKTGTTTYKYWSTRNSSGAGSFTVDKTTYDEYKIWIIGKTSGTTGWGSTSRTLSAKYMLEKGSSATSWEPYVGGKASPSPEYPQSISTVTGRNVVEIIGKNKFNNSRPSGGSSLNITTDNQVTRVVGDITSWWNLEWTGDKLNLVPGETYTARCFILDNPKNYTGTTNIWFDIQGKQVAQAVSLTAASGYQNTFTYVVEQPLRALRIAFASNNAGVDITFCIQIEKGSTATDFVPYSKQTYEINLGKNLFDVEAIPYVAKRAYSPTGAVLDWSDYTGTDEYQPVEPNTEYTLWNNKTGNTTYLCEYDENKNFIKRLVAVRTFTTTANTRYIRWSLSLGVGAGTTPPTQTQLEKGSTASSYASYFDPIELCGLGDDGEGGYLYKDNIYRNLADGKWYVHKEISKAVLTSSGEWRMINMQYSVGYTYWSLQDIITAPASVGSADIKCAYFRAVRAGQNWYTAIGDSTFNLVQDTKVLRFSKGEANGTGNLDSWKSWVDSVELTVYYPLDTPIDTEITNEELISQLRDLWNATGYDDKTEISLLSYGDNSRAILGVCQYPNHIPVASQYKVGSVTVGDGLLVNDGGRISLDMSYIGTNITKISNSEIDTIMGVQ